jgi:hypothetical protein
MIKIKIFYFLFFLLIFSSFLFLKTEVSNSKEEQNQCVICHSKPEVTPLLVLDWKKSLHSEAGVTCDICHGDGHKSMDDVSKVQLPTPGKCSTCHKTQYEQFRKGKHSFAWISMNAMPSTHYQPMEFIEGKKGY